MDAMDRHDTFSVCRAVLDILSTDYDVFEMVTQHPRKDWDAFDAEGREVVRRWYKMDWDDDLDSLIQKICDGLTKAVSDHIDETAKRLAES